MHTMLKIRTMMPSLPKVLTTAMYHGLVLAFAHYVVAAVPIAAPGATPPRIVVESTRGCTGKVIRKFARMTQPGLILIASQRSVAELFFEKWWEGQPICFLSSSCMYEIALCFRRRFLSGTMSRALKTTTLLLLRSLRLPVPLRD